MSELSTLPMTITVELWAFGSNGQERNVLIPPYAYGDDQDMLEQVFKFGQNDFQPQKGVRSVSVGDIAMIFHDHPSQPQMSRWLCDSHGWRLLTLAEYHQHVAQLKAGKTYMFGEYF